MSEKRMISAHGVRKEETMAEYIDRKSVLNDIGELFTLCYETLPNECGHHFIVEKELETHWDFVKNLPAADVAPVRHGHWIFNDMSRRVCSLCGNPVGFSWKEDGWHEGDYCQGCGAKMDEVSE